MRLIDADALENSLGAENEDGYVRELLKDAPTVDATPVKHGHWFDVGSLSCRCSECGCKNDRETRFCPICGAKMDLEGEQ